VLLLDFHLTSLYFDKLDGLLCCLSVEDIGDMSTGFNNIRQWLVPQLDKKGISVEQFARAAGISRASIYCYMDDTHRPSTQMMKRMCHVLGVPLEEGLRQYSPTTMGRPKGSRNLPTQVRV